MPWFTDPGWVLSKCHRWRENVGLVVSQGIVGLETLTGDILSIVMPKRVTSEY